MTGRVVEYGHECDWLRTLGPNVRNLMGSYDTREEALRVIFDEVRLQGHAYVDSIVLLRVGPRGD